MGSEDLFHKRKARRAIDIERNSAKRKPYDRILIVCEGEKTEPFYFEEMKVELDLDSANIKIDGSCDSSPRSVVEHAITLFERAKFKGEQYDRVFCVFDRDQHETFDEAIDKVKTYNKQLLVDEFYLKNEDPTFTVIRSTPSFEYWFLLHYTPTTRPFLSTNTKSSGDQVIDELRTYITDYKKKKKGIYKMSTTKNLLNGALAHSKRIFDNAEKTGDFNPSTNVHTLVNYLQNIKEDK
jgi:hypothetical protein